jgi:Tfp pilus assembly PilM family ATPase
MRIPFLSKNEEFVLVEQTDQSARYVVVRSSGDALKLLAAGEVVDANEETDELSLAARLRETLDESEIACKSAMLLLSRPQIESVSETLPPASKEELPSLVASAVAQESEDAEEKIIDFMVTGVAADESVDVLAMTCDRSTVEEYITDFRASGFSLPVISYAGLGAVELLGEVAHQKLAIAVSITFGQNVTNIAVLRAARPVLFRTLHRSYDSTSDYAEALASELDRTLAFIGAGDKDSVHFYMVGCGDELREIASLLAEEIASSVSITGVVDLVDDSAIKPYANASYYANLIGVASAVIHDRLDINFAKPREISKASRFSRRSVLWSSIAAIAFVVLGYAFYSQRSEELAEIEEKRGTLQRFSKRASKAQQFQDTLDAIKQWQRSDIAWLDELKDLSERFPEQNESLVKRMSMSAGPDGGGVMDLSVQVKSPDVVTEMEASIRDERHSVSSKRVAEVTDIEELTWSFDTKILFRPLARPALKLVGDEPEKSTEKRAME